MAFFTEKVRRRVPGNFIFVLMTDRNDLDNQIYRTFVGCGVADERTPRAGTGKELEQLLKENHRYIADDFVAHCATRWASGKSLLVCIDKITCARVQQRILPRWQAKAAAVRRAAEARQADLKTATDPDLRQRLYAQRDRLVEQAQWLDETIIGIIISEGQNEVADFKKWDFDIIPHRALMKQGFETADGKRVERWTEKEQTQAEVETTILDQLYRDLPSPPFTDEDKQAAAAVVYRHVWQQSVSGAFSMAA